MTPMFVAQRISVYTLLNHLCFLVHAARISCKPLCSRVTFLASFLLLQSGLCLGVEFVDKVERGKHLPGGNPPTADFLVAKLSNLRVALTNQLVSYEIYIAVPKTERDAYAIVDSIAESFYLNARTPKGAQMLEPFRSDVGGIGPGLFFIQCSMNRYPVEEAMTRSCFRRTLLLIAPKVGDLGWQ